ncbi:MULTISPECIES: DUF2087 domain-containing protein [unclassified Microbacterium]|uniref:DUF2087 domain-containing protein n=2 Tax=Microbacterium TaxID=33882 RepID=UPI0015E28E6B|nr:MULTISPECIES: DUF2087 domain-containing protein [unclassified Microbacterium]
MTVTIVAAMRLNPQDIAGMTLQTATDPDSRDSDTAHHRRPERELLSGENGHMTDPHHADLSKWIDDKGRIRQYPRRAADRATLLKFIADKVIATGEVLTEEQLNKRLAPFTDDVAALRRYLVVAEHLDRTRDGSAYTEGSPPPRGSVEHPAQNVDSASP